MADLTRLIGPRREDTKVVTLTAVPQRVLPANPMRQGVSIEPISGTAYVGRSSGVTTANGYPFITNVPFLAMPTTDEVWAVGDGAQIAVGETFH